MNIAAGLLYTEGHEWAKIDGEKAYIGITDYAQEHLGDIVFIELPEPDANVDAGERLAVIESVKAVSDVNTPLSGTIIAVNEELEGSPELLNKDPYENYIAVIAYSDMAEKEKLMSAGEYEDFCIKEDQK